jgi:hypothetical protein
LQIALQQLIRLEHPRENNGTQLSLEQQRQARDYLHNVIKLLLKIPDLEVNSSAGHAPLEVAVMLGNDELVHEVVEKLLRKNAVITKKILDKIFSSPSAITIVKLLMPYLAASPLLLTQAREIIKLKIEQKALVIGKIKSDDKGNSDVREMQTYMEINKRLNTPFAATNAMQLMAVTPPASTTYSGLVLSLSTASATTASMQPISSSIASATLSESQRMQDEYWKTREERLQLQSQLGQAKKEAKQTTLATKIEQLQEKEASLKTALRFNHLPLCSVQVADPQFHANKPVPFREIYFEFFRNCMLNGKRFLEISKEEARQAQKDAKQTVETVDGQEGTRVEVEEFLQRNLHVTAEKDGLSDAAGKALPGFIKFILEEKGIYSKMCQGVENLIKQLNEYKLLYMPVNDPLFNLSWDAKKNAWSTKIEVLFFMSQIGQSDQPANGRYVAEVFYQENGSDKLTISMNAQFYALDSQSYGLSQAALKAIMQKVLATYQRTAQQTTSTADQGPQQKAMSESVASFWGGALPSTQSSSPKNAASTQQTLAAGQEVSSKQH